MSLNASATAPPRLASRSFRPVYPAAGRPAQHGAHLRLVVRGYSTSASPAYSMRLKLPPLRRRPLALSHGAHVQRGTSRTISTNASPLGYSASGGARPARLRSFSSFRVAFFSSSLNPRERLSGSPSLPRRASPQPCDPYPSTTPPRVIRLPRQPRAASIRDAPLRRGGSASASDREIHARYPQRLVSVGRLLADPRGAFASSTLSQKGTALMSSTGVPSTGSAPAASGSLITETTRPRLSRWAACAACASRARPPFCRQPGDADLSLDRAAVPRVPIVGVGVEDVDDPGVGVLVHGREEISGQSGARVSTHLALGTRSPPCLGVPLRLEKHEWTFAIGGPSCSTATIVLGLTPAHDSDDGGSGLASSGTAAAPTVDAGSRDAGAVRLARSRRPAHV